MLPPIERNHQLERDLASGRGKNIFLFLLPTLGIQAQSLHSGPDTCKQGLVWREARPGDHVCLTSETRTQTADDNRRGLSRRIPGEDTCKQGYVWREAFPGDLVCVRRKSAPRPPRTTAWPPHAACGRPQPPGYSAKAYSDAVAAARRT
jgi:hypothetical protein